MNVSGPSGLRRLAPDVVDVIGRMPLVELARIAHGRAGPSEPVGPTRVLPAP